jgi:hypothetical protein
VEEEVQVVVGLQVEVGVEVGSLQVEVVEVERNLQVEEEQEEGMVVGQLRDYEARREAGAGFGLRAGLGLQGGGQ